MSALPLAAFITQCRQEVGDTGVNRESMVRDERLEGVDGTNKRFSVLYFPIAPGPTVGTYDFQLRKTVAGVTTLLTIVTDYSLDAVNGVVATVAAPAAGDPIDVLLATYHFLWYPDTDYYGFVIGAASIVGVNPTQTLGTDALRAADCMTKLGDPFLDSMRKFVGHLFNKRRAVEYATRFASSAGGQSVNTDAVTANFKKLADEFFQEGIQLRDDVYKRRGARESASFAIGAYRGTHPGWTPRR
jgi:hypothetical protein